MYAADSNAASGATSVPTRILLAKPENPSYSPEKISSHSEPESQLHRPQSSPYLGGPVQKGKDERMGTCGLSKVSWTSAPVATPKNLKDYFSVGRANSDPNPVHEVKNSKETVSVNEYKVKQMREVFPEIAESDIKKVWACYFTKLCFRIFLDFSGFRLQIEFLSLGRRMRLDLDFLYVALSKMLPRIIFHIVFRKHCIFFNHCL